MVNSYRQALYLGITKHLARNALHINMWLSIWVVSKLKAPLLTHSAPTHSSNDSTLSPICMQRPSTPTAFLFLLFFGAITPVFTQEISQDTLMALEYRTLYQQNEASQFTTVIQQGEAFLKNLIAPDTNSFHYGNLLMIVGTARYNYGSQLDSTLEYLQQALRIFTRLDHVRMADVYERIGQFHFYYTGDYQQAEDFYQKAEAVHLKQSVIDRSKLCSVYMNLGFVYTVLASYERAWATYKKALDIQQDAYDSGNLNNALGDFYYQQSLYAQGLIYFSKAEIDFKKHYGETSTSPNIGAVYANKGNCYMHTGDYTKAINYYSRALQIFERDLSSDSPNILRLKTYMGFCYADFGQFDRATELLQPLSQGDFAQDKGLQISILNKMAYCYAKQAKTSDFNLTMLQLTALLADNPYSSPLEEATAIRTIGVNYSLAKNYPKSLLYFQRSLDTIEAHIQEPVKMRNYLFMDLGYLYYNLRQIDASIFYFEKAINTLNLPEDKTTLEYYYNAYGLSLSKYQEFLNIADTVSLDRAIELMEASVAVILNLRNVYVEQADKQFLNSDGNEVFEKLIEMLLQKNRLSPDAKLIKRCLWLSEQNKNTMLLENIVANNVGEAVMLADSIRLVNLSIHRLSQRIKEAEHADSLHQINYLRAQYLAVNQIRDQLIAQMNAPNSRNFEILFQSNTITVDVIQRQLLAPDQCLLEYFVGDSSLYLFVVRPDTFVVQEVKRDFPLEDWIEGLRQGIYGYYTADRANRTDSLQAATRQQYIQYAPKLYEKLIAPVAQWLPEKVVIVPDGPLGYVPFDALLPETPQDENDFKAYPYLLKKYQFSYTYSATLLRDMRDKKHHHEPSKPFAAFAPFYDGDTSLLAGMYAYDDLMRKDLQPLVFSGPEVAAASKLMRGETFAGSAATEKNFTDIAGNYRILHLATHGRADNRVGDYAFLAFSEIKDSIENELLYVKDLYNLELNADLVVLSACETGIGKLQRGEGIISLARAFAYAGAKSIVTTLWEVNDKSTSELMRYFYRELRRGKDKDEALRLARLRLLKESSVRNSHPFFWAAFVPVGDMRKIK